MKTQQFYALILFIGLVIGVTGIIVALLGLAWHLLAPANALVGFLSGITLIVLHRQFRIRLPKRYEDELEHIRVNQI